MKAKDKSYRQLVKEKDYNDIANILMNNNEARKDNRVLLKAYYKDVHGMTLDRAFKSDKVLNYGTVERYARLLKTKNHKLRYDKRKQEEKYKAISREIPVVTRMF